MRNISFALTKRQFKAKTKLVTRRMGWSFLKPGEFLCGVEKSQGLKPGEQIVRMGTIRVLDVRWESLYRMVLEPEYGKEECKLEGFPEMTPEEFVEMFCGSHKGCAKDEVITRIEFKHVTLEEWCRAVDERKI